MTTAFCSGTTKVFLTLCQDVGSPFSLSLADKARRGDWVGVISSRVDPTLYSDPHVFARDYACVEFLRKCNLPLDGFDRKAEALKGFWSSEQICARTNTVFSRLCNNGPFGPSELELMALLEPARDWIRRVLGPLPTMLDGKFGPGATFGDRGRLTTIPDKMSSRLQSTSSAACFRSLLTGSAWDRALLTSRLSSTEIVRGNRFTTVPKDATKDRGICIEPSLNVFFQLDVGTRIKTRLFNVGLDLINGQEKHKQWACKGSRDGSLATIDLSSASDTVAYELVRWLLPPSWFSLLDALRSPMTNVEGKWVHLEKFSSMGNGYTFELETLIFASLCHACGAGTPGVDFLVYGDDIIVPIEAARRVLGLLKLCGFTPNERKTFIEGPFRESCGGDFFNGVNVRPYYLKELPHEPQDWIKMANGIRRLVCKNHNDWFRYTYPYRAWLRCLDNIPSDIRRLRGPSSLGDLCIHDDEWEYSVRKGRPGIRYVRVYRPVTKPLSWKYFRPEVVLASALYGCPSTGVLPRGSVTGYKVGYIAYS